MKPPCEIIVWYVIPAIRAELAKSLLDLGMKQKHISELLDITQPAVSQYTTSKRGQTFQFDEEVKEDIRAFAAKLIEGTASKEDIVSKTCAFCSEIKTEDLSRQLNLELSGKCKNCLDSKN